jgi:ectoine hydroxylase-related dioxygenase (phytanoyl-CoA dioxygenase family)
MLNLKPGPDAFHRSGLLNLEKAIDPKSVAELQDICGCLNRPGKRVSERNQIFQSLGVSNLTHAIQAYWPGMQPVRMVAFNKSADANWGVPWHQDRVIAVKQRFDLQGFSNWTSKSGAWHCEPPISILKRMLFVRLYLDDVTPEKGAMAIALGSHEEGLVPADQAASIASRYESVIPFGAAGDATVLPMLTLHRSSPNVTGLDRRTLRIDFADAPLPAPLAWAAPTASW